MPQRAAPMLAAAAAMPALLPLDAVGDGVWQAIALVGASELGDKTFFLSALIAMKEGRTVAFVGSMSALTTLTAASVGVGQAFRHTPDFLATGLPVGDMLATGMFTYFGLQMLREARALSAAGDEKLEAQRDAEEEVAEKMAPKAERSYGGIMQKWPAFLAAFSLVFIAEVGDKSMFATIALAREFSPAGVLLGALIGHALATGLAVVGGSTLSAYISQATVSYVGGALFLVFAAVTAGALLWGDGEENDGKVEAQPATQ